MNEDFLILRCSVGVLNLPELCLTTMSSGMNPLQTMRARILRRLALPEALALALFVMIYVWRLQSSAFNSWIIFPVWLLLSFALHSDTPKTLGWRADNLWPATRTTAVVFGIFTLATSAVGLFLGAPHRLPAHLIEPHRFAGYFAFCLLQEVGLQSYLMNRLLTAIQKPIPAALVAGTLFSLMHWPNPVLVPLTFVGGTAFCWIFARERNIIPLTIAQAILGSLVWWAFPVAWHHSMRVGPGFYSFQLPN
jgi:CAAX prenyl protease-like protein